MTNGIAIGSGDGSLKTIPVNFASSEYVVNMAIGVGVGTVSRMSRSNVTYGVGACGDFYSINIINFLTAAIAEVIVGSHNSTAAIYNVNTDDVDTVAATCIDKGGLQFTGFFDYIGLFDIIEVGSFVIGKEVCGGLLITLQQEVVRGV